MEVTVARMKELEKNADAAGLSYTQMMENAGQAATNALLENGPESLRSVVVFCGSGNNGGDGYVLARAVHQRCFEVRVVEVDGEPKTPDAILNWTRAKITGVPVRSMEKLTSEDLKFIQNADAVVDAVYGTGFHGELRPAGKKAAELFNQAAGFKLALDLPSGLEADTGRAAEGAFKADRTVTFHASKPCHRLAPEWCGPVDILPIGIESVL